MKAVYKVHLCVIWLIFLSRCGCTGENYERTLVRKLLEDYDTSVRPSKNASQPLNVTFGLALTQIIDVDERNQILTTNCWLNQMWIDYSLKWNPADYGGIKVIRIPAEKVWKPDIILYNNADSQYNLAILSTNVIVTSDGNLTWLSTAIFKSSCQINVEFFPFDEQNCTMKFASWTYDGFQVNLVIGTEDGDLSNYVENGEWDLINMRQHRHVVYYSCCQEPYPDITYTIVLRRRPLFYVFNLILPCVLISGLALLSFYMPSDSGEKVTLGITTLLSMTVFLMVIGESMPPTSEKLPLIGLYYGVTISLVSFATGLSVVTLNIHHRGMRGRQLPPRMRKFIFCFLARVLCLRLEFPNRDLLLSSQTHPETLNRRPGGNSGNGPSSSNAPVGSNASMGVNTRNINPRNPHSRKLPVSDTWRIVYPDMPATPPNLSCYCDAHQEMRESWQRKSRNHILDHRYSSYGNLQIVGGGVHDHGGSSSSSASGNLCANCYAALNSRFRPVMRVRGMPSAADGPLPQVTRDDSDVDTKTHNFSGSRCYHCPPPWEQRLSRLLHQVHETMEKNETRMVEQDRKEMMKLEWQQAALVIDRLLLWIFVIATIGATFGILYMSPHTKLFTT